jgi:glycine/D-amino acid oxidase-like deaminating enzyme
MPILNQSLSRALPKACDVVVVGGGVVGVAAALTLAERGQSVLLCEKGRIACEQSSRNWGWIRQLGRDPKELPLMQKSLQLWRAWSQRTEVDIGFREHGITYLAETESELIRRAQWLDIAGPYADSASILDAVATDKLLGRSDRKFYGAVRMPDDARAEPTLAVPALAALAERHGATLREGVAVRALLRKAGTVCGVATDAGPVRANAVILAGGIWSRVLLENEGVSFPQLAVRASVMRTAPAPSIGPGAFGSEGASLRPRLDGGYTIARAGAAHLDLVPAALRYLPKFVPLIRDNWRILSLSAGRSFFGPLGHRRWEADEPSPFEAVRCMSPDPDVALLSEALATARWRFPSLANVPVVERWAGLIDTMPDECPVIDHVPGLPGLVVASGFSGHGFGIGPGGGAMAADLATGTRPAVDPAPFRYARYANLSPLN